MQKTRSDVRLIVRELDTDSRADVKKFIELPFTLYKDCEQWLPPIILDAKFQLNRRKNPFYLRNEAAFFLAERDGIPVGRIAVFDPQYLNDFKKTRSAHFNLFECVNDRTVANALFETAAEWARERGLDTIRGPFGFMAADGFGFLAKGFELRPTAGIPYNFEYYNDLAQAWGFQRVERALTGYFHMPTQRKQVEQRLIRVAEAVQKRYGFTVRSFNTKRALRKFVAPRIADIYNRTLTHIAGDPPVPDEELKIVVDNLLLLSNPKLHKFIMKDDEFVGFLLCFVGISDGIKKANGRLFPFGYLRIMRDFKETKWVNYNGIGIVPEYQGRGGTALMYAAIANSLLEFPEYEHAEVIQISEFNHQSLNEMKKFGVTFYKEHWIYSKPL
jgi:hypothetical protein